MKAIILSLVMAAFALPAFAQSSDTQAQSGSGQASPVTAENLKKQLTDAGFQQVQVLDATYLVQAQTKEGNRVLMLIDPPETTGSTTQGTTDTQQ